MIITQTESTNMNIFKRQRWEFRMPLNYSVIDVKAPENSADFINGEVSNILPSNLIISWPGSGKAIDSSTHKALLDESLREYSDLWRTLAEK